MQPNTLSLLGHHRQDRLREQQSNALLQNLMGELNIIISLPRVLNYGQE